MEESQKAGPGAPGNSEGDPFDAVYWWVVSGVIAPHDRLRSLLPDLRVSARRGNSRYMYESVRRHLPDGTWEWPAYLQHAKAEAEAYDEDSEEVNGADIPDRREMVVLLCRRISTALYHGARYEQLADKGLLSLLSRWRFHWLDGGAEECRKFDGVTLPAAEAKAVFPRIPCDCLTCSCRISAER